MKLKYEESLTSAMISANSHLIAFAAEKSRITGETICNRIAENNETSKVRNLTCIVRVTSKWGNIGEKNFN
ncbi:MULTISPECIES: hypothetical protein [Bacillus cereus group]|uniref:hypothetical protein n=1 Tax=Bacillus cereus group TaxID=86661 RepID=UPI0015970E1E|nr:MULTISPECIES: hypothetical protein [Bacillus cereus group]MDR4984701.1 hypothetical protein [Bacillus cereus]MEA1011114.1 hypothetical protein [Bacillus cereus]